MKLTFRNKQNQTIDVDCTIFESPLTKKWGRLLEGVIQNDFIAYVKNFSLVGNLAENRPPEQINPTRRWTFIIYAWATWLYRFFLFRWVTKFTMERTFNFKLPRGRG